MPTKHNLEIKNSSLSSHIHFFSGSRLIDQNRNSRSQTSIRLFLFSSSRERSGLRWLCGLRGVQGPSDPRDLFKRSKEFKIPFWQIFFTFTRLLRPGNKRQSDPFPSPTLGSLPMGCHWEAFILKLANFLTLWKPFLTFWQTLSTFYEAIEIRK